MYCRCQSSKRPRYPRYSYYLPLYCVALAPIWPKRSTFVAKRSIGTYASFGLLVWFLKAILIDRSNLHGCIGKLKTAADIIKNEKVNLFSFWVKFRYRLLFFLKELVEMEKMVCFPSRKALST